jgi:hypothetical protein
MRHHSWLHQHYRAHNHTDLLSCKLGMLLKTLAFCAAALGLLTLSQASAGTSSGGFNVTINTGLTRQTCTSTTLSQQTQATVTVVCATGQFVSIESSPGKPFAGTHGGAYRYVFSSTIVSPSVWTGESNPFIGTGTITSLRVLNLNAYQDRLEMLVSF